MQAAGVVSSSEVTLRKAFYFSLSLFSFHLHEDLKNPSKLAICVHVTVLESIWHRLGRV